MKKHTRAKSKSRKPQGSRNGAEPGAGKRRSTRSSNLDASCRILGLAIRSRAELSKRDPEAAKSLDVALSKLLPTETVRAVLGPWWQSHVAAAVGIAAIIVELLEENQWSPDDLYRENLPAIQALASYLDISDARVVKALKSKRKGPDGSSQAWCPNWQRAEKWSRGPNDAALLLVANIEGMSLRIRDHVSLDQVAINQRALEATRRIAREPKRAKHYKRFIADVVEERFGETLTPEVKGPDGRSMPALTALFRRHAAEDLAETVMRKLRQKG